ncbi:MAG: DNA helicase RecQ, partial [Planctomycetales bacterium]
MMQTAHDILSSVFGYQEFRGPQAAIIQCLTDGEDAVVLMPTGGGKSLCFQIPAILREGVAIVVSPLIALMKDQVGALLEAGVRATYINSSLPARFAYESEQQMVAGDFDLVYVAPERLMTDRFQDLLKETRLALFAIDEAHCVSQWGHDFRPEYLQLAELAKRFPEVPRIALTATADIPTRKDISERLQLGSAQCFISGFDRPNICYRVVVKDNVRKQLFDFIQCEHVGDSGIVYCATRRGVEQLAEWLNEQGMAALPYHAGLSSQLRHSNQDRFLNEDGLIVVATLAFGMGIDKPDVRFVAHYDPPRSLEAYYQETGRAGRDGLPADAWMAYGLADIVAARRMIDGGEAPEEQKRIELQRLGLLHGYCETTACRRQVLLKYFAEDLNEPCGNCDTCMHPPEAWSATIPVQKFLSCVFRTGQRFGAGHVADVLLGSNTQRMKNLQHDRLSTYGIGDELSKRGWHSVARQLVAMGLLSVDYQFGSLRLTQEAQEVLCGDREVHLRRDPAEGKKTPRSKKQKVKRTTVELSSADDQSLFEALRSKRGSLARQQGAPPYVIFHDTAL